MALSLHMMYVPSTRLITHPVLVPSGHAGPGVPVSGSFRGHRRLAKGSCALKGRIGPMQTHTILVVEPAEHFRAAIRRSLQQSGYRVLESTTGAGALTLAAAQRPNLILMDVELPDGDGLEVAQELRRRQETSRIPIVVLSGEGALGQRAALIAAFCAGSIPKSVALERLERDLRLLLSMARTYVPRRFLRYPVEIPAFYRRKAEASTGEEEAGAGIVRTLSEGGARFDLPNPMPAATILDLRLQTPGGEVSTAGKVVYSRHRVDKKAGKSWYMHGIQFTNMDPKTFDLLKPLMDREAAAT